MTEKTVTAEHPLTGYIDHTDDRKTVTAEHLLTGYTDHTDDGKAVTAEPPFRGYTNHTDDGKTVTAEPPLTGYTNDDRKTYSRRAQATQTIPMTERLLQQNPSHKLHRLN